MRHFCTKFGAGAVLLVAACIPAMALDNGGPYLLDYGVNPQNTNPTFIRDNLAYMESRPFDGVVISNSVGFGFMDGGSVSYTTVANAFAPLAGLTFTKLKHNFAAVYATRPADFFDDWSVVVQNFANLARVLKERGIEGIFFDNEEYQIPVWNYPNDCKYTTKTLQEYEAQTRLRGKQIMQAMVAQYPEIVVIFAHGPYVSCPSTPEMVRGYQSAASYSELMGPFMVGFVEGAGPSSRVVDGGEVYAYRTTTDFQNSYQFRKYDIASSAVNWSGIPTALRPYWPAGCNISFGVYNRTYPSGFTMTAPILQTTLTNALKRCDNYTWLYLEGIDFFTPGMYTAEWLQAVVNARNAVPYRNTTATAPSISTQPTSRTVAVGQTASFSVVASGTAPLSYQWRKNGANLSGANTASYTTPATTTSDNGALFSVVVSNSAGSVTSNNATLTVNSVATQPTISSQPASQAVTLGQTATFSVSASGSTPLAYQWRKNGVNLSGATSASYTTPATTTSDNGALFSVVVSNSAGSATSNNATLTVNATPPPLPSPWAHKGIGSVGLTGDATYSTGGVFTVKGAGADIWGSSDAGHFAYRTLSGDGQIVARLTAQGLTHTYAKAGVMIRETLSADAKSAFVMMTGEGANFQRRTATAGACTNSAFSAATLPVWMKLVRSGSTFTASVSSDGSTWTTLGTDTISMASTCYIALAVTSHDVTKLSTVTFDNVTVTGGGTVTVPAAPTGLSASAGNAQVALSWTASSGASSYKVKRATSSAGPFSVVGTASSTSYTASGLTNGTQYYFCVSAVNSAGESADSTQASATPTAGTTGGSLPAPWVSKDIGSVGLPGSGSYANAVFTVKGAGSDIWNTSDGFQYVHQPLNGDGQIVARVTSVQNTHSWAKAGIMIRENLTTGARHASVVLTPSNGISFQRRVSSGGSSSSTSVAPYVAPRWVKLVRSGSTFSAYHSADGSSWSQIGTATISMPSNAYVGLAVTAHNNNALCTSTLDNVSVGASGTPPPPPPPPPPGTLPSPWVDKDVGTVGAAGSAGYANGTFSVNGSGADIWGTADGFNYVHQPLTSDVELVARVASIQNTNAYAKAGVMVRESLNANSTYAMIALTPTNGVVFLRRTSTGGSSVSTAGPKLTAPCWLKLVTSGSTLTGYYSSNGSTWSALGSVDISMPNTAYAGLAVTSHQAGVLNTSTFDNVNLLAAASVKAGTLAIWSASALPNPAKVGEAVAFTVATSVPAELRWDFGDGAQAQGETVSHAFAAAGFYPVRVTATDASGATQTDSVTVQVLAPVEAGQF